MRRHGGILSGFGGGAQATAQPHTSSRYKIHTSDAWDGYPTHVTECPNFAELKVASAENMLNGSYLLVDDEIFHVAAASGTVLTTLRARSGTVAAGTLILLIVSFASVRTPPVESTIFRVQRMLRAHPSTSFPAQGRRTMVFRATTRYVLRTKGPRTC